MRAVALLAVCACGRIDFVPRSDGSSPGGPSDTGGGNDTPAAGAWSKVQVVSIANSMVVAIAPSKPGDLVVVAMEHGGGFSATAITDDAGDTYAAAFGANAQDVEAWYAEGVAGGATTITISAPSGIGAVVAWEFAGIKTSGAFDLGLALANQPSSLTPTAPAFRTAATGELVVAVANCNATVTSIHAGNAFTNDSVLAGDGWAHLTDASAPAGTYQATWDLNGAATYSTIAFGFLPGP
jgi:hypothetical protein